MRRPRIDASVRAVAFGAVAVLAAFATARGPAVHEHTVVDWPAATPAGTAVAVPSFTPLLLSTHTPDSLVVDIAAATVAAAAAPIELLGSTRDAADAARVSLVAHDGTLEVRVGDARGATPPGSVTGAGGALQVRIDRAAVGAVTWSVTSGDRVLVAGEAAAPDWSGFASAIDPTTAGVHAQVRGDAASSHPSTAQWAWCTVAVVAAAGAAVARRGTQRAAEPPRGAVPTRHPATRRVDAVVVGATVAWWLLGPWYFDDGWLMATVRGRAGTGSFGNVFDTLGAQMPLGFAHHVLLWPFAALDAPFLLWRVVPVAASLATWVLVRRLPIASPAPTAPTLVTLAAAHLVGTFAWLVTLRPEPVVALLGAVALTAAVRTRATAASGHLAPRGLLVALLAAVVATTMHPSGIVVLAPLVLVVRPVLVALRRAAPARREVIADVMIAAAVGLLLLFADTDLSRWRVDRGLFAGDGFHSRGVMDEPDRYRDLLANGTLPQLASVLVGAVALVALAIAAGRRVRADRPRSSIAVGPPSFGGVLLVAVLLLSLTPSKWTYHFGSLSAMATVAIGAAAAGRSPAALATAGRAREPGARGGPASRVGAMAAALVVPLLLAVVAARSFRDARDPQYFLRIGVHHPALLGSVVAWAAVTVALTTRRSARGWLVRWAFAAVLGPVALATLVLFAVLAGVEGPAWSTGHAALDDLVHGGCPFLDAIAVTDLAAGRALHPAARGAARYDLDGADDLVVALRAPVGGGAATLQVTWQRDEGDARRSWPPEVHVLAAAQDSVYGPAATVRHVRIAHDGTRPRDANVVALSIASDSPGWSIDAVTAVIPSTLRAVLADRRVLVSPPELPLLRCTTPPAVRHGVAEPPDVVIGFERRATIVEIPELGSPSGPWFLAPDAYDRRVVWGWLTDTEAFAVTILRAAPADVLPFTVRTQR